MEERRSGFRILTMIGLVLALGLPLLPVSNWGDAYTGLGKFWGSQAAWGILALVILVYVLAIEQRPLSSIGFRKPRGGDIGWALLFGLLILAGMFAISAFLFPLLHLTQNAAVYQTIASAPLLHRVALVTRAAVCEEILFRGYGLERIDEATGRVWLAGLVTFAVFTFAHLAGWGPAQLIPAGFAAALLTILYMWRRNLWGNMLAHWIVDGVGFVVMPMVMAHH